MNFYIDKGRFCNLYQTRSAWPSRCLLDANVDKMNGVTPIDRTLFKDGASALYS